MSKVDIMRYIDYKFDELRKKLGVTKTNNNERKKINRIYNTKYNIWK